MTDRIRLDDMTDAQLDQLHARLERAETFVATVADIIAGHNGDEWANHPATAAIRRGFGSVPHTVGDVELRRQLAAAVEALGKAETELAALRQVARGYCGECGRGDASPTAQQWEEQKQRADQAEELLRIAHDTSNTSEAERARAAQRAEQAEAALERTRRFASYARDRTEPALNDWQIGQHELAAAVLDVLNEQPEPAAAGHNDGPSVRECAAADRRWWNGEKAGE